MDNLFFYRPSARKYTGYFVVQSGIVFKNVQN